MSRHARWIALAMVSLCATLAPVSAQKTTIDPNTVQSADGADDQSEKTDARLAQKVTYEARRKTMLKLMDELAEQTGVALKVGQNSKDWQVRDRKMSIFAKDVPLASLMNSIARVMKFKWSREGKDGAYIYRIYMDRRTLLDAETRLQREEERIKKAQSRKREETFNRFAEASAMTPEQLEKLKEESPFLYVAAKSGVADSLGSFFGQVPAAAEALASGQEMSMNAGMLSPAAQQNMIRAMRDLHGIESKLGGGRRDFPEDIADNLNSVTVNINSHMEEMRSRPEAAFMLGMIEFQGGGRHFGVPLIDPESAMGKMIGKLVLRSLDEGKPINEVAKDIQGEFMQAVISDIKSVDVGEKSPEHADEPALHEKVNLKPKTNRLDDIQAALAEASGLSVVSDYFGRGDMMPLGSQEGELKTVLDRIGDASRYNWEKRGQVIEFRHKDWYRKRASQIPEAWLETWRKTLKDTGTLDVPDLAQMAVLSMEQINDNIMDDPTLMSSGLMGVIFSNREVLRLYAGLSGSQQAMMFTEGGLDLRTLTPEQWKLAQKLIGARNSELLQSPEAPITISGTRTPKGKRFEYQFIVSSTDAPAPLEWKLTTPEYREPPKEEPKPVEAPRPAEQPKAGAPGSG